MLCPYCHTENREDREACYICGKDISTIRLVVNKARQHYNDALEHAERGRSLEAIEELKNAVDLDSTLVNAHVVLGTLFAREGQFAKARLSWQNALALQPELQRAHDYLERVDSVEVMLPTMRLYRWVAIGMFILATSLSVMVIYLGQQQPGTKLLSEANELIAQQKFGEASEKLNQASVSAQPDTEVKAAATALSSALALDIQQRIRVIQDLKYRQMFPEALDAIADLASKDPGAKTLAILDSIRGDILYYYHSLIAQLYNAFSQGDLDFETLQDEINRFIAHYPSLPESDEIRSYLSRAERMEIEAAFDNIRRRFLLDNNVETAVEGIRDLSQTMGEMSTFKQERQSFIEEILSTLFNLFTGYLDQNDFSRASKLLNGIERITREFRDVIEVDISGAVELARSVLKDARRQYVMKQIEKNIELNKMPVAEEALWAALQEPDLSPAEMSALRGYWRRINRDSRLKSFLKHADDKAFFELKVADRVASDTLFLYEDTKNAKLGQNQRKRLLGLSAAAAVKLGENDEATSIALQLRKLDEDSTYTQTVNRLIKELNFNEAPQPGNENPTSE